MWRILCATVLILATPPAWADAAAAAIEGLGLVGTWADDCTWTAATGRPGFRMIFAVPPGGTAIRTTLSVDAGVRTTVHAAVLAADRLDDRRVRLRLRIVGGERGGGPLPNPTTNTFEQVIEMAGADRIYLIGAAPASLTRCPD